MGVQDLRFRTVKGPDMVSGFEATTTLDETNLLFCLFILCLVIIIVTGILLHGLFLFYKGFHLFSSFQATAGVALDQGARARAKHGEFSVSSPQYLCILEFPNIRDTCLVYIRFPLQICPILTGIVIGVGT